jgi:hypothetical protein
MEVALYNDDFSLEEKESLAKYVENGCPGLTKITDDRTFQWFELYMSGKTFSEIAEITKEPRKDLILYIADKSKWHELKISYYRDISVNLAKKLTQVKIDSTNTVATIASALGKYYSKKFNKFLSSNDDHAIEEIDTKMLATYYKSLEMLDKILNPTGKLDPNDAPTPTAVNVHMHGNAKMVQNEDGSVDITDTSASELLQAMANFKKATEKK